MGRNRACTVCGDRNENLTYHRFPANTQRRNLWCQALHLNIKDLPKYCYVCSGHFKKEHFVTLANRTCLLPCAVPRIRSASPQILPQDNTTPGCSTVTAAISSRASMGSEGESESTSAQVLPECPSANTTPGSSTVTASISSRTLTASEEETGSTSAQILLECPSAHNTPGSSTVTASGSSRTLTASESDSPLNVLSTEKQILMEIENIVSPLEFSGAKRTTCDFGGQESRTHLKKRKFNVSKPRYFGDIKLDHLDNPATRKHCWEIIKKTVDKKSKKIAKLCKDKRRLKDKIYSLQTLTSHLQQKSLISEGVELTLNDCLSVPAQAVFNRLLRKKNSRKYPSDLRKFALTLYFYSRNAYEYVRENFANVLPHVRTLTKWIATVNACPGFMREALNALHAKCTEAELNGTKILCNLVMDEMSIYKKIEWFGQQTFGYIDMGTDIVSDNLSEAKEALVFLLVALNGHWKIPVAYFMTNGLSGKEKASLILNCLEFVHHPNLIVTSLTFDGAPNNISMANNLGASINALSLKTHFKHPITNEKVYIFLDPCHMIKLVRNCLGTKQLLHDGNGNKIDWTYIQKLEEYQEKQELHAATRLRSRHINWEKEKMKVSLAVQTLSNSVASALQFLANDLNVPLFKGSEGTSKFCAMFNNLFDILNSRNLLSKKPYERALSPKVEKDYFLFLNNCENYIKNLKLAGISVINSERKTGFLGFLVCIQSLKELYVEHVYEKKHLLYILSYKLSQDHLEILFSCIRTKCGHNNNPTSRQFQAIMRKILIHTEIKGSIHANSVALDSTSVLHCSSASPTRSIYDRSESSDWLEHDSALQDHTYCATADSWNLTLYVEDVIAYISGFVVRKLKNKIKCYNCLQMLEDNSVNSKLQIRKTYGVLICASEFVIEVCRRAEKCIRIYKHSFKTNNYKNLGDLLTIKIYQKK